MSIFAATALAGCSTAALAKPVQTSLAKTPLGAFQTKEARLFDIGFRLGTANSSFCDRKQPTIGLLLHDARSYGQPSAVRRMLGLSGDIGVQAVAKGSPAYFAGLRQNATIVLIDGDRVDAEPGEAGDWRRAAKIRDKIELSAEDEMVEIAWREGDGAMLSANVPAVASCASIFELLSDDDGAAADGRRVLVGEDFPGFAYSDEELAAVLAHEMAHNLLGHIAFLAKRGDGGGRKRNTERDADRLMPWLLANAGYDPRAASRMMRKYGPEHGGGLFRTRSHDGWDERVEMINKEIAIIASVYGIASSKSFDWRTHFKPILDVR